MPLRASRRGAGYKCFASELLVCWLAVRRRLFPLVLALPRSVLALLCGILLARLMPFVWALLCGALLVRLVSPVVVLLCGILLVRLVPLVLAPLCGRLALFK